MDSKQMIAILTIVTIIIFGFISIGACLYAIPICYIRRFHTPIHLLSRNVCTAAFICTTFWTIYYIMSTFYPAILWSQKSCLLLFYLQTTVNCGVLYALCMVSLNRLFTIIYKNNALFRKKKWVAICVCVQWIYVPLIASPLFASSVTVN
jgi:hypothetical protein